MTHKKSLKRVLGLRRLTSPIFLLMINFQQLLVIALLEFHVLHLYCIIPGNNKKKKHFVFIVFNLENWNFKFFTIKIEGIDLQLGLEDFGEWSFFEDWVILKPICYMPGLKRALNSEHFRLDGLLDLFGALGWLAYALYKFRFKGFIRYFLDRIGVFLKLNGMGYEIRSAIRVVRFHDQRNDIFLKTA